MSSERCLPYLSPQRLQYPVIKEYSLSHIRDPTTISGIFLNYGILGSLGSVPDWFQGFVFSGVAACLGSKGVHYGPWDTGGAAPE